LCLSTTSPREKVAIKDADSLVLKGSANSEEQAWLRGKMTMGALQFAFARLRVAADFGRRRPTGQFTDRGLEMLEHSVECTVLNNEHGLMVYPAQTAPSFVSVGTPTPQIAVQDHRLGVALRAALDKGHVPNDQERLAYDLFAASFFEHSADARLVALVMAIETLLEPRERSSEAREHVGKLIESTQRAQLPERERESLLGSLRWLRQESITAAGKHLVNDRLGDRRYGDYTASKLWAEAYDVRSKLVHGSVPRPSHKEVGIYAAKLETMVSALLSRSLIDIDV
jgi:hypothetical protein